MDNPEEKTIIGRVQQGDRDAYAYLVDAYKVRVFNLALRMTGAHHDAADLAQETFIKAYESIQRFDVDKKFYPWLHTIAMNLIRNHLKRKKLSLFHHNENRLLPQPESVDDTPEDAMSARQDADRIADCLHQLPLSLKEAVVLRFYQGLSFQELSEILDISLSSAKMRVYRGIEKLAEIIKRRNRF